MDLLVYAMLSFGPSFWLPRTALILFAAMSAFVGFCFGILVAEVAYQARVRSPIAWAIAAALAPSLVCPLFLWYRDRVWRDHSIIRLRRRAGLAVLAVAGVIFLAQFMLLAGVTAPAVRPRDAPPMRQVFQLDNGERFRSPFPFQVALSRRTIGI